MPTSTFPNGASAKVPPMPLPSVLPQDALQKLRSQLAEWRFRKTLSLEAAEAVVELCAAARAAGWSPEQLVVAVKDACYSSSELTSVTSTSERDTFLAKVVTACIKEYFRPVDSVLREGAQ